jgi:hypothetical protein
MVTKKLAMSVVNSLAASIPRRTRKLRENEGNCFDDSKYDHGPTFISNKYRSISLTFDTLSIHFDQRWTILFRKDFTSILWWLGSNRDAYEGMLPSVGPELPRIGRSLALLLLIFGQLALTNCSSRLRSRLCDTLGTPELIGLTFSKPMTRKISGSQNCNNPFHSP